MFFLMFAGIPQAIKSIKQGHSNGMSPVYITFLIIGFMLMITYISLTKPLIPLIINYTINIISLSIVAWYKIFPRHGQP